MLGLGTHRAVMRCSVSASNRALRRVPTVTRGPSAIRAALAHSFSAHIKDPHDLFRCTSSRWLYSEEQQLAARYMPFNIHALMDIATKAAGASRCTSFEKMVEGSNNRFYLLRFDNDVELVAKIPFAHAGPRFFGTASEVATMDFVRTELELPAPRVRAWSARATGTQVGVEFILYDKIPGVPLDDGWWDARSAGLSVNSSESGARSLVLDGAIEAVARVERELFDRRFAMIGSLYYKEDVPVHLRDAPLYGENTVPNDPTSGNHERFRIGPCLWGDLWKGGRASLNIDRGPWSDNLSFVRALVSCERTWLKALADGHASQLAHLDLLDGYERFLTETLPERSAWVLWHSSGNGINTKDMFISEATTQGQRPAVTLKGITDWQGALILPGFIQSKPCPALTCDQPSPFVHWTPGSKEAPVLAEGYENLNEAERKEADCALEAARRAKLYEDAMAHWNPAMSEFMKGRLKREMLLLPLYMIGRGLEERWGLPMMRQTLIAACDMWPAALDGAPTPPCPLQFSDEERKRNIDEFTEVCLSESIRDSIGKALGIGEDGKVAPENYEEIKAGVEKEKEEWLERVEPHITRDAFFKCWPFREGQKVHAIEPYDY